MFTEITKDYLTAERHRIEALGDEYDKVVDEHDDNDYEIDGAKVLKGLRIPSSSENCLYHSAVEKHVNYVLPSLEVTGPFPWTTHFGEQIGILAWFTFMVRSRNSSWEKVAT